MLIGGPTGYQDSALKVELTHSPLLSPDSHPEVIWFPCFVSCLHLLLNCRVQMQTKIVSVLLAIFFSPEASFHTDALKYFYSKGTCCVISPATIWLTGLILHFRSIVSCSKKPLLAMNFTHPLSPLGGHVSDAVLGSGFTSQRRHGPCLQKVTNLMGEQAGKWVRASPAEMLW